MDIPNPFIIIGLMAVVIHGVYRYFVKENLAPAGPHKVGWRALEAITISVSIYFLAQMAVGILAAVYILVSGKDPDAFDVGSVLQNALLLVLVGAFTFYWLNGFLKRRVTPWRMIGLKKPVPRDLAYALAGFGAYFVATIVAHMVISALVPGIDFSQEQELPFEPGSVAGIGLVLVFIGLVVMPPLVEETLFRGFIYSGLLTQLNKFKAVLVTSFLFAIAHLQFGSGNALLWAAAIDTFVLSVILIYLRDATKSLAAPMLLHGLKNGLAFVILFVLPVYFPNLTIPG